MNANALSVVIHAPTIERGLRIRLPEGTDRRLSYFFVRLFMYATRASISGSFSGTFFDDIFTFGL